MLSFLGRTALVLVVVVVLLLAVVVQRLPSLLYPVDEVPFSLKDLVIKEQQATDGIQRNVVVTGANSGLGLATVQLMAQLPRMNIIMACRSLQRCEAAKLEVEPHSSSTVTCVALDLGSRDSIEAFAASVQSHLVSDGKDDAPPPIHILVNNAGHFARRETVYTVNDVESHIFVNHLGHVLLTHLLWQNLVVASPSARVVNVSSLIATLPVDASKDWHPTNAIETARTLESSSSWWSWMALFGNAYENWLYYARSKASNLMFTAELHHRYADFGMSFLASHPGMTITPIMLTGFQFLPAWVRGAMYGRLGSFFGMVPLKGAETQVRAALDDHQASGVYVGPRYWTVGDAVPLGTVTGRTSHHWPFSRDQSRKLWDQSLEVLGIQEFGVV